MLDGVDHAISEPHRARHVATLITIWAEPYLSDPAPPSPLDPAGSVVVTDAGTGRYSHVITAGRHVLTADEPVPLGGTDTGPNLSRSEIGFGWWSAGIPSLRRRACTR